MASLHMPWLEGWATVAWNAYTQAYQSGSFGWGNRSPYMAAQKFPVFRTQEVEAAILLEYGLRNWHSHFCHSLLVKQFYRAQPDSRRGVNKQSQSNGHTALWKNWRALNRDMNSKGFHSSFIAILKFFIIFKWRSLDFHFTATHKLCSLSSS